MPGRSKPVTTSGVIDLDGHRLNWQVTRSKRKTVQLVLKNANLLVIKAPLRFNEAAVAQIVARRRAWLLKHITDLKTHPYAPKPLFENDTVHFLLGQPHTLQVRAASVSRFSHFPGRFLVSAPADDPALIEKLLYRFYAKQAKICFNQRLQTLWPVFCAQLSALYPHENWAARSAPNLKIRRMKSRFGSMSAQNQMTLNTELVRAAPQYIDYVIVHELCHLKHMNHSRDYYALLSLLTPQWRELKHELARLLPLG